MSKTPKVKKSRASKMQYNIFVNVGCTEQKNAPNIYSKFSPNQLYDFYSFITLFQQFISMSDTCLLIRSESDLLFVMATGKFRAYSSEYM